MKKLFPIFLLGVISLSSYCQISIEDARKAGIGAKVTVTGVALNGDELGVIRYIQDETGAIAVYPGSGSVALNALRGDRITVSGTNVVYAGLLEIDALTSVEILSSENPLPDALVILPNQMGSAYEAQLIKFKNVTFVSPPANFSGNTNYKVSYEGKQGEVRINKESPLVGEVIPTGAVNLTGICSRYNSTFQMLLRDPEDIEQTSPIFFTEIPVLSNLSQTGFTLRWETNIAGSTEILYGNTLELEKGEVSVPGDSTVHQISITGANPSELLYVKALSITGEDTAMLDPKVYITQSSSSGDFRIYFNREVDNSVSTGVDAIRAYRAIDDTLINYINRAEETIDFTIYNFNLIEVSDITAALNAAHTRGITVRVIHDGDANNAGFANLDPAIGKLISPPSDYLNNIGIMHNKFIVFDAHSANPNVPIVWTGSTNFTDGQVNTDPNSVIIFQDQSLAKAYSLEFNEMFGSEGAQPDKSKSLFGKSKKDNTPHEFIIGGRQVECYFSPSDNVHSKIKETIGLAKSDISVATMLITKSDIGYALRDQQAAGRNVRVIVNSKGNCSATVVSTLESALGNQFLDATESGIMHHKYMIIDHKDVEPILWVGCHNWSTAADERNDENTLVIHDATIANIYYQEFYQRFSASGGSIGIQALELNGSTWKIYPNPVQREFNILYDGDSPLQAGIAIYDLGGKCVMNIEKTIVPGLNPLSLSYEMQKGLYILQINTKQQTITLKLIME